MFYHLMPTLGIFKILCIIKIVIIKCLFTIYGKKSTFVDK